MTDHVSPLLRYAFLREMGIRPWVLRQRADADTLAADTLAADAGCGSSGEKANPDTATGSDKVSAEQIARFAAQAAAIGVTNTKNAKSAKSAIIGTAQPAKPRVPSANNAAAQVSEVAARQSNSGLSGTLSRTTSDRIAEQASAPAAPPTSFSGQVRINQPPCADGDEDVLWSALQAEIAACHACELVKFRRHPVPGIGVHRPSVMFIGEGPGAEEDARGEPFVGQAGQLLDAMLDAIGLNRTEQIYITNAVKCRPPGNRTPESEELHACASFLNRQIALCQPKLIVLLGLSAAKSVLAAHKSLGEMRQKSHEYQGIPVIVTYHPAYLLRNLPDKIKAWEDLLNIRHHLTAMNQINATVSAASSASVASTNVGNSNSGQDSNRLPNPEFSDNLHSDNTDNTDS